MAICIVCKFMVTPKTGFQCQGSCSAWVHYSCLDHATDDGRKMVHEPYSNRHICSDVFVVTQLNDNDKRNEWNNNNESVCDQYVNMDETANQITQETVIKGVSQGAHIYKSRSLGMCSLADTAFYGYFPRPIEYIPCGNMQHILLPNLYSIQCFPTANQYGNNSYRVDAVNAGHDFNSLNPYKRPQEERFYLMSTTTQTDVNFPAVSYMGRNSHCRPIFSNREYLHTRHQLDGSYRSRIPVFCVNNPTFRHTSTEASNFEYFNPYNYSEYLNYNKRKSQIYESRSVTTVGVSEIYENLCMCPTHTNGKSKSTLNLPSLSDSFDKTPMSADLTALNAIKYNVAGMHLWTSSKKINKDKEKDMLVKKQSTAVGPSQSLELSFILEKQIPSINAKIKVSIKQSKSAPLSASPQTTPVGQLTNKSPTVVIDKMVENVPLSAECQTSKTLSFSDVKNHAVISTNTSLQNSIALVLSRSVGSYNSKLCPSTASKITETAKKVEKINNSLANNDKQSCLQAKRTEAKHKTCEPLSANSITNLDTSIALDLKIKKASPIYSWTKLDVSNLPDTISENQINKIFGKLLPEGKNRNPEETDDPSADNIITTCMKNVLSTFEMLSSQIGDIFNCRKKESNASYCSTSRSEGVISIVRNNIITSSAFEKKHECLTVKLLTFGND